MKILKSAIIQSIIFNTYLADYLDIIECLFL